MDLQELQTRSVNGKLSAMAADPTHNPHLTQRLVFAVLGTTAGASLAIMAYFLTRLVDKLDNLDQRMNAVERVLDSNRLRMDSHDTVDKQVLDEQRNLKRMIQIK